MTDQIALTSKNKIYFYNATALIDDIFYKKTLKIPDIQREIDNNHVAEIVNYQLNYYAKNGCFHFVNCIIIASINNNEHRILDGQHRVHAIKKLIETNEINHNISHHTHNIVHPHHNFRVMLSVIECKNEKEANEQFMIINMNKQMTLHTTASEQTFINKLRKFMQNTYPEYLKRSTKPQIPHFNLDHIDKHMKDYGIVTKLKNNNITAQAFIKEIKALNTFIKQNPKMLRNVCKNINNVIKKANKKKCNEKLYLRAYNNFDWIEIIILKMEQNITYEGIYEKVNNKRVKIPQKIRSKVWKKRNGERLVGECFVCKSQLLFESFECGHIISVYHNGSTELSNLEPICRTCNSDMSVMNLNEFKNIYEKMCN